MTEAKVLQAEIALMIETRKPLGKIYVQQYARNYENIAKSVHVGHMNPEEAGQECQTVKVTC